MSESIGPRTYLVGQALNGLLAGPVLAVSIRTHEELADQAIRIADAVMDKMRWPDGKPVTTSKVAMTTNNVLPMGSEDHQLNCDCLECVTEL